MSNRSAPLSSRLWLLLTPPLRAGGRVHGWRVLTSPVQVVGHGQSIVLDQRGHPHWWRCWMKAQFDKQGGIYKCGTCCCKILSSVIKLWLCPPLQATKHFNNPTRLSLVSRKLIYVYLRILSLSSNGERHTRKCPDQVLGDITGFNGRQHNYAILAIRIKEGSTCWKGPEATWH